KVCEILQTTVKQSSFNLAELRVLDLGAGNGMVGEILKGLGVCRLVGVDIIPEAKNAAERDRPGIYDEYYVADIMALAEEQMDDLASWELDCLMSVAALGFGDIPKDAFIQAFNLLRNEGWVAFNIKETFLDNSDTSGLSTTIRELIFSEYLDLYHLERYRHRLSIEGEPLYYFAIAGRKNADIPPEFIENTRE
ncbi:MAG: class I SAM-dependent methyltransferase, partial [Symploca sp. SIO3C6]|nr:class I SAM-dependent methyltransferase [Symploca sp. SIO3C6]